MTRALIFFVLLLVFSKAKAQESDQDIGLPKHYFYWNPGALINLPSGVQIGYDRNLFKRTHLDIQGGFLLFSEDPTFNDFAATDKKGIRFQTSLKNYLSSRFYVGPTVLFKRVTMYEKIWLERFGNSFEQRINLRRYRRTIAAGFDVGFEHKFENSQLYIEFAYSIGIQNFNVRYENIPDDANTNRLRGIGAEPGTRILPFFNYNIKLKYPLSEGKKSRKAKKSR